MKKNILLVGDHPLSGGGNSNMMRAIIGQIDTNKFNFAVVTTGKGKLQRDIFTSLPFKIITPKSEDDKYGSGTLLNVLCRGDIAAVLFVGIDIWVHAPVFKSLMQIKKRANFVFGAIFPYDLHRIRNDWCRWIACLDFPCVYSQYGFNLLKPYIHNLRYYRPPLCDSNLFYEYSEEDRISVRQRLFNMIPDDSFIFGYVGSNLIRKAPERIVKAFSIVKEKHPNSKLYLHTKVSWSVDGTSVYDLSSICEENGLSEGDVITRNQNRWYNTEALVDVYNSIDCLVNASMQEGLSWTLLESMLCGTPVIAADNTAQSELIRNKDGELVACPVPSTELGYVPVLGAQGPVFVESACVNVDLLADTMSAVIQSEQLREKMSVMGKARALNWLSSVMNINGLLFEMVGEEGSRPCIVRREKVIFAQHSAAGDVLMTTRCLKGIKERHPDMPLVYMTQHKYQGLLEGNPYIDELVDWDPLLTEMHRIVYNPHGERILPGHWGRNSNSILSDFYWKILDVNPCDFYVPQKEIELPFVKGTKPVCVVHTTGGDPIFRTYKFMPYVIEALRDKYIFVQLGSYTDYLAGADYDYRGKLTYAETAYVASQADIGVTVDSYMSHLLGALGISQVALYGSGNALVCRPYQTKGNLICLSPDYVKYCRGLGPCSGSIKDCPAKCMGLHDPQDIVRALTCIEDKRIEVVESEIINSIVQYVQ